MFQTVDSQLLRKKTNKAPITGAVAKPIINNYAGDVKIGALVFTFEVRMYAGEQRVTSRDMEYYGIKRFILA